MILARRETTPFDVRLEHFLQKCNLITCSRECLRAFSSYCALQLYNVCLKSLSRRYKPALVNKDGSMKRSFKKKHQFFLVELNIES
jgi:hypothetical protein